MSSRTARRRAHQDGELEALFYSHSGRIVHKWNHYLPVYERHFAPLRNTTGGIRVLELGVSRGGSLQLWREYFGAQSLIVGIDADPSCNIPLGEGISVIIGDQANASVLDLALLELGGSVDVVIDDGSHFGRDQIATFNYLYPRMSEHGVYVCEDLQCSYWQEYEGGRNRQGTFVEHAKTMLDSINSWFFLENASAEEIQFGRSAYSVCMYLGIAVIEKAPIEQPFHVQMTTS